MKPKYRYRLRRFHRHFKVGYVCFACGMIDVLEAVVCIWTGDYRYALTSLCLAILILIIGLMSVQVSAMRRFTDVVAERTLHVAFRAGANYYELRERCLRRQVLNEIPKHFCL